MNKFDNKLKEVINQYNSDIDPNEIWEGIQNKRYPKKKNRRFAFLLLAASLLLLITSSILIINYKSNDNKNVELNKNVIVENNQIHKSKSKDQNTSKIAEIENNSSIGNNNIDNNKTINEIKLNELNNTTEKARGNKIKNQKSNSSIAKIEIDETKNNKQTNKNNQIDLSSKISQNLNKQNRKIQFSKLYKNINQLKYYRQIAYNIIPKTFEIKKKTKINLRPSLELDIAANYVINQFSLNDNDAKLFMSNKKENETPLEAFDITLLVQKPIFKNLSIYTGLNYGQIDSKLDFSYKEIINEEVETVTKMVINSIKDTTKIYERAMIKSHYDVNEKIYNYRKYIRVPILLAYHGKYKRIGFEIRSGVDINILTSNKGRAITPSGMTSLISAKDLNLEKEKTLGDFHFDLRIVVPLSKNMILTYGPQYKLSLESLMQKSSRLSQLNHSLGANIGLKYSL